MINRHDSWTHRLPPEILVAAASHLRDDASLVAATHVCHFWRVTLLSSSRLWSHLDFANEGRALVFLDRSKSTPLSVDIGLGNLPSEAARGLLNGVITRVTTLRSERSPYLDELLAQPVPVLEALEITEPYSFGADKPIQYLPSLKSLVVSDPDTLLFRAPLLTYFHLTCKLANNRWSANPIIDFLGSCPLLEVASLRCGDPDMHPDSDVVVSLPLLRSFTHELLSDRYTLCLFDHFSLPPACRVALVIDVTEHLSEPWVPALPTPRDSSYLSDVKTVRITAHPRNMDFPEDHITFKLEFASSTHRKISFNRISYHHEHPSFFSHEGLMDLLENAETGSVETLCFDRYPVHTHHSLPKVTPEYVTRALRKFPNLKTLILSECNFAAFFDGLPSCPTIEALVVHSTGKHDPTAADVGTLSRVQEFTVSRKEAGSPLKTITIPRLRWSSYRDVLDGWKS